MPGEHEARRGRTCSRGAADHQAKLDSLLDILLPASLEDLKEITHDFLYENYRTEKLSKSVEGGAAAYDSPLNHSDNI